MARDESDASFSTGQQLGPNLANPDECRSRLLTAYGDMANAVMDSAKREVEKLPVKVREWIDRDMGNGQRLGNHPDVVLGLALRPYAKLSAEAATKELETIRKSAAYQNGDKLAVAKASMLQLVVSRGAQAPSAPQPNRGIVYKKDSAFGTRGGDPTHPSQGTEAAKALRAELNKLQAKGSDLFSGDGQKRKRAIARRQEIQAQLESGR